MRLDWELVEARSQFMDIMTLLGHTTLQMNSRYSHAMPEQPAYGG